MFEAELRDKNGDLKKMLTDKQVSSWEYLRVGGCGQADVITPFKIGGDFDNALAAGDELRVKINDQLRYSGKLLKVKRIIRSGEEGINLTFYGYISELSDVNVNETYEGMEISDIIKDILDNYVVGVKKITYNDSDIEETNFSVASVVFNHDALSAIKFLADLAGDFEWGVDRNKSFYFKQRDTNVRRTYSIGREIYEYEEDEDHESVKNVINVFGANSSVVPLATINSAGSVLVFGRKETNIFESSIVESSDANRLGLVTVKNMDNKIRQIQVKMKQDDYFVESSHPLGATTIVLEPFRSPEKYGHNFKYGQNKKYGSLKRDQISAIRYTMVGGGMDILLVVSQDIANMGDQQKQVELQIKDLQRR